MSTCVLGVSGSVAAYRAADLARDLMRRGFTVRVCLTDAAQNFVTPALFEALTGQPCLVDPFEEPERGRMAHIDWARQADLLLLAPATANTMAKLAQGVGDDMLTTIALAYEGPILIAPAMNPSMYAHEGTRTARRLLESRGAWFVEPVEGDVACGENGQGKLASVERIANEAEALAATSKALAGKHVLITNGPTQEFLDDVRFLTNRSSGRMGAALVAACLAMGARVTVVSGPVALSYPRRADVVRVRTALDMLEAAQSFAASADVFFAVAAVADYRPDITLAGKMRRADEPITLKLVPNPDIVATIAHAHPKLLTVAFAAEPTSDPVTAAEKMRRKGVRAIAMNDVSRTDIGFESPDNELTLLMPDGTSASSGLRSKLGCARWLVERVLGL